MAACAAMTTVPEHLEVAPADSGSWHAANPETQGESLPRHLVRDRVLGPSHGSHEGWVVPRLVVHTVATGGLVDLPSLPDSVRHVAASTRWGTGPGVLVLDLGPARFEAEVLLKMLTSMAREIRAGRLGDVMLVVATGQDSVARIVQMVAEIEDLPMYVTPSPSHVWHARPAGRLTPTEKNSLVVLDHLGGQVTANEFATETSLELTAAGNRLTNLARRGYVFRVARSRREGDLFVGLAALHSGKDDEPEGNHTDGGDPAP